MSPSTNTLGRRGIVIYCQRRYHPSATCVPGVISVSGTWSFGVEVVGRLVPVLVGWAGGLSSPHRLGYDHSRNTAAPNQVARPDRSLAWWELACKGGTMASKAKSLVCGGVALALASIAGFASGEEPIPEFYGFYAVSGGTLTQLYNVHSDSRVQQFSYSMSQARLGLAEIGDVHLTPDTHFLAYGPDWRELATRVQLWRLNFVTEMQVTVMGIGFQQKVVNPNLWLAGPSQGLRVGPVRGQADLFKIVPDAPLQPGAYVVGLGPLDKEFPWGSDPMRFLSDFYVGEKPVVPAMRGTLRAGSAGAPEEAPIATPGPSPTPLPPFADVSGKWAGKIQEIGSEKSWDCWLVLTSSSVGAYQATYHDTGAKCDYNMESVGRDPRGLQFDTVGGTAWSCRLLKGRMWVIVNPQGENQLELLMFMGPKEHSEPKYRAVLAKQP